MGRSSLYQIVILVTDLLLHIIFQQTYVSTYVARHVSRRQAKLVTFVLLIIRVLATLHIKPCYTTIFSRSAMIALFA